MKNESQHSAVKYLDKCFSSLRMMSFTPYDYKPRIIYSNVQNVPLWLSHKQEFTLSPLAYGRSDVAAGLLIAIIYWRIFTLVWQFTWLYTCTKFYQD